MRGKSFVIATLILTGAAGWSGCASPANRQNQQAAQARWNASRLQLAVDLARQQYDAGQFQQALKSARDALQIDKNHGPALLMLARVQLEVGQMDEATANLRLAQHLAPDDPQIHYVMGTCHERMGDPNAAAASYRAAWRAEPDYLPYTLALAQTLAAQHRQGEALDLLNGQIDKGRQDVRLFFVAGQVMAALNMNEPAESMYYKALQLKPDDPALLEACAFQILKNGKPHLAVSLLEKLDGLYLSTGGEPPLSHHLALGECYLLLERYHQAQVRFDTVRDGRPNDAIIYKRLAQTAVGLDDWSRARVWIDRARRLKPDDHETLVLSAHIWMQTREFQRAEIDLREARALAPQDPLVFVMTGRLAFKQGNQAGAQAGLRRALELDPANPIATQLLREIERVELAGTPPNSQ